MSKIQKEKKTFPFYRLIPNIITIAALCFGLTAIKYALDSNWEKSLLFLVISALLDTMDGRIARYLNVTSDFGANLDSLADFVDFGIVPPFIIYTWTLADSPLRALSWGVVLIFAICGAMRLARFNIGIKTQKTPVQKLFFTGVPITIGGILAIAPLMVSIEFPEITFVKLPLFNTIYLTIIALAMSSKLPTFSVKHIHISKENVKLLLATIGSLIVFLIIIPWITIIILCLLYIISIPISGMIFYRKIREERSPTL
jgi:CDP-diacylglycerol--serine O-phosphatidyltransferase